MREVQGIVEAQRRHLTLPRLGQGEGRVVQGGVLVESASELRLEQKWKRSRSFEEGGWLRAQALESEWTTSLYP